MSKFRNGLVIALTGSVLMSFAVVMSRYFKAIRSARKRVDSLGSQVIETACGPVEYKQVGEGYPVLSIHGGSGLSARQKEARIFIRLFPGLRLDRYRRRRICWNLGFPSNELDLASLAKKVGSTEYPVWQVWAFRSRDVISTETRLHSATST